jgi:CRISPR-associated protein Csx10
MKKIKYRITTLDPIIISSESGNQFMVPTKDYIPGINILGALAANYIQQKNLGIYFSQSKPDDANFLDWFINGKVSFSNAYKTDKINDINYVTYPIPFSIQHVKNDESKILDLLYEESEEQTKPFNGFGLLKDFKLYKTKIKKSTDPHHERNYATGAPKQNVFFNYESIEANQTFEGTIYGDDNCIEEFYNQFSRLNQIKIGRSKSSEYGKVQLSLTQPENKSDDDIILNEDETISLTFLSNVILYNENGFASGSIKDIELYLKDKISQDMRIEKAFLRTEEIENYVSVWKLKKPSEVSFQAGSCLLLKVKASDIEAMEKLQSEGIGERKHEGFGRIIFGLQRMRISKAEFDQPKYLKPESEAPALVKNKTLKIAEEHLKKISAVEALKIVSANSKGLNKKISSSQIGKLEGICRISDSDKTFKERIDSLRKISKEKLISCHFANSNLFDLLTKENILNNPNIKKEITKMGTLFNDVGIELTKLEKITSQLYSAYYLNLFAAMRKAIKGGQK